MARASEPAGNLKSGAKDLGTNEFCHACKAGLDEGDREIAESGECRA